jgi:2,5-diketo-D-gluconate reductase B
MTLTVSADGAEIPAIGLGTWQLAGDVCRRMVQVALEAGYRHIDTAAAYGNETEVGEAIRASTTPRDQIFVTTKVWHDSLRDGALQRSAEASLKRLDIGWVDLLLIHWPSREVPLDEQIRALCDAKRRGLARHIGVSNFPARLLDAAVRAADEPIVTDQVEYHPFVDQTAVASACRAHGIALTAYMPLARGRVFEEPVIREIAEAKGKSPAQVVMRWHIEQPGVVAIPRSSRAGHVSGNIDVFDFALTPEEMGRISRLASSGGRLLDPSWGPDWDNGTA